MNDARRGCGPTRGRMVAVAFFAATAAAVLPESADSQGRRLDLSGLVLGAAAMTAAALALVLFTFILR